MNTPDASTSLRRFLNIQSPGLSQVRAELEGGRKATHWMWFVFPRLAGLETCAPARRYAIATREEAVALLEHRVLGSRLRDLTRAINAVSPQSAREIFGPPDDLKFQASMTLFAAVSEPGSVFTQALDRFFGGAPDPLTLRLLAQRQA